jgi:hypothetical protein
MDGIETTINMRKMGYTHPVVALTANAVTGQAEIFYDNGFDEFISKPIDIRHMDEVLKKYIRDKQSSTVVDAARRLAVPEIDDELLSIFVRDVKKTLPMIEAVYKNIDEATEEEILLFTVGVHAMKSALAHINEPGASRLAYTLEKGGKAQDRDVIKSGTPILLDTIRGIVDRINQDTEKTEATTSGDEDREAFRDGLLRIADACNSFDDRAAEGVLTEFKDKPLSDESKELLENIAQLVLHSDFEEAAEMALRYVAANWD